MVTGTFILIIYIMVTSLFNIFNASITRLFEFNSDPNKKAITFADDLICYISNKNLM